MIDAPIKKAAGVCKTTTATTSHYATNFRAAGARQASAEAAIRAGIGRQRYRAAGAVLQLSSVHENTLEIAGNLPDSEVFSRPKFKDDLSFEGIYGYGRDGLVRKAGRMAISMFSTSRPPVALEKAASGLQSQIGAETMTTVNTTTTPKSGNTSPLARQQAIENALSMALYHARHGEIHAAIGRAIRATSMLKQACSEVREDGTA